MSLHTTYRLGCTHPPFQPLEKRNKKGENPVNRSYSIRYQKELEAGRPVGLGERIAPKNSVETFRVESMREWRQWRILRTRRECSPGLGEGKRKDICRGPRRGFPPKKQVANPFFFRLGCGTVKKRRPPTITNLSPHPLCFSSTSLGSICVCVAVQ
jgi:hypothetical protein